MRGADHSAVVSLQQTLNLGLCGNICHLIPAPVLSVVLKYEGTVTLV